MTTQPLLDATEALLHSVHHAVGRNREREYQIDVLITANNGESKSANLGEGERKRLSELWGEVTTVIDTLPGVADKTRPIVNEKVVNVDGDSVARLLPKAFLDAYELLYITSYGSGATKSVDENSIHGSGRALRGRTNSDQVETHGGAKQKRRYGSATRNTVLNLRAYHRKVNLDKKLRRLSKEVYQFLNSEQTNPTTWIMRCGKCKKLGEDDWQFCPRCSAPMTRDQA